LEKIKKRYKINRVIIVADRGINIKGNLNQVKEAGYGYIMAAKIKGADAALQKKVLADDGFINVNDEKGNMVLRYKIIEHENKFTSEEPNVTLGDGKKVIHKLAENMVVSYSPKRAKKDKADRERLVEKAKKLLENPEQITSTNKRGGKKYINQIGPDTEATYALAIEKIESDAKFDGYYAIQTSEKTMTAMEIMEAYHMLWKIEESFRIMKSCLEFRPVYHYKPSRIKGHFVVCFLAFLMERKMELLLKSIDDTMGCDDDYMVSPIHIKEALNSMQLAAVTTTTGEVFIKTKPHPLGIKIFNRLKLDIPANISSKNALITRFKLDSELAPIQLSFL